MNELDLLASDLGTSVWTLRRAIASGLVRARRPASRSLELNAAEVSYLLQSWRLLSTLRAALRTEPGVRLAVLFGSQARGSARPDSDIDLLVVLADESRLAQLETRLSEATQHRVVLALLDDLEGHPTILAEALRDGRVMVDRASLWPRLLARRRQVEELARRERARLRADARAALAALASEAV
jgi:predicted nucleotidyltransferase